MAALSLNHRLDMDPELGAYLFYKRRRELGEWRGSGWLWCCVRSCWWCSRCMTKRSSPAGSCRGRRGPVREEYKVVALLLKQNLGLFGLVVWHRVLQPHPESATATWLHQGITTLFKPTSKMWGGMMWFSFETTPKTITMFTNPSARAGYDTRSILKWSLTGLNSEFSFSLTSCLTKAEEPSLPYYLPVAGGRIIGFIPFPMVLVLCEMQSVSSRIWTRVAVSISLRR